MDVSSTGDYPAITTNDAAELREVVRRERKVELANEGFRVICAGLDMDFQGNPFGAMPQLLATAEHVRKVHAICMNCGNLAYVSHRTVDGTGQIMVGAEEKYKPLCRSCHILEEKR